MNRAVITGIGMFTPLGNTPEEFFKTALSGTCRLTRVGKFDVSDFAVQIGGEICWAGEDYWVEPSEERGMSTPAKWSLLAARKALKDAGLDLGRVNPDSAAVVLGNSISSLEGLNEKYFAQSGLGMSKAEGLALIKASPSSGAVQISREFGITGETLNVCTACSSTTNAIGYAARLIRDGESKIVIAGGAEESLTPFFLGALGNANHLSRRNSEPLKASRPFDRQRDGYVLSDAACIFVIEEYQHALSRGANVYCELRGFGASSDATSVFKLAKSEETSVRALEKAIGTARLSPSEIDYYCALGVSMQWLDVRETRMLKCVFQEHARKLPISSIKSVMGHPLGAAGAVQAATCALAIREGAIPPTINYEEPDPECDLDYVPNEARSLKVRNALLYSLGNGGANAALVLSAC